MDRYIHNKKKEKISGGFFFNDDMFSLNELSVVVVHINNCNCFSLFLDHRAIENVDSIICRNVNREKDRTKLH